uniref:UPAR/Ly6 domain-containing protein n=1 Tax=Sparus aurata TaxID=8175 RepID=A0A671WYM5_SPAAU
LKCVSYIIIINSLTCNTCQVWLAGKCRYKSTETCSDSETNSFNNTRLRILNMESGGCLNSTNLCGRTLSGSLLGAGYTSSFRCCTTNLCNGATSVQLPLTVAICAAILSSLWGMWEM